MVVYWGILIWVFVLGQTQSDERNPLKSNHAMPYQATWGFAVALMLPVTLFAMLRGPIMDTTAYIDGFKKTPNQMTYFEEFLNTKDGSHVYYGVQMIFKCFILDHANIWLALIALIEGLLICKFFQLYSPNMVASVYVFIASTQFTYMYNGIRQFLAVAVIYCMSEWLIKGKWYCYIPIVLFLGGLGPILELVNIETVPWYLGGIHQSALLMAPLYFLLRGKPWNWKIWAFIVVFAVLAVTGAIEPLIGDVAQETEYAVDFRDMDKYAEIGMEDDGAHPIRAVVPLVPVIMAFYKRKEIEAMGDDVPPIVNISINAAVVTEALYICSVFSSGILIGRLPIYTELYNFILIPWLILHPYKKNSKLLFTAVYGIYLLWFLYQMYIAWGGVDYSMWLF